jgi:GT2 family glycosyltransferase
LDAVLFEHKVASTEAQSKLQQIQDDMAIRLQEMSHLKAALEISEDWTRAYKNSTSWRITAPIRAAGPVIKGVAARSVRSFSIFRPLRKIPATFRYGFVAASLLRRRRNDPKALVKGAKRALLLLAKGGPRLVAAELRHATRPNVYLGQNAYERWVLLYDTIADRDQREMRSIRKNFRLQPTISIIMPVYNTDEGFLREAIDSVRAQTYPNWELCIADDASTKKHVRHVLDEYADKDARIKVVYRPENGHISKASNSALELAAGEWIALLDHDDRLAPHALFSVVDAINKQPDVQLIYTDEDKIDRQGVRHDPYFKSDWNPMLFLSHNLVTHLGVYSTSLVRELGGFRAGYEGAQDYDLALRVSERLEPHRIHHIPHVLYHWRVIPGSTALASSEKPYAMVLRLTTYARYEIILVDNGSDNEDALAYFAKLSTERGIRVLRDERPFNYSALNNHAAKVARGTVLALVNNDVEVISRDWLNRMVSIALQQGVGAVGAKLIYPDDTVQHGGVVLGLGGLAAHAHSRFPRSSAGYVARAALAQNFSAVTAACLVVRKDHYDHVGGLNEIDLAIAYNDVDFCLKLTRLGLRNVWTPFVELYHFESATRGYEVGRDKLRRFEKEQRYMLKTWKAEIDRDPACNPNLTFDRADFGIAFPPREPLPWRRSAVTKLEPTFDVAR